MPVDVNLVVKDDQVQTALKEDKGDGAKLVSWTTQNFTNKGDNFATIVTALKVCFTLHGEKQNVSYIVKVLPQRDFMPEIDKLDSTLFIKEVGFFNMLVKPLNRELVTHGLEELRIPKYVYTSTEAKREIIILEDLRECGFIMYDRTKSLDESHTNLVVQELARLHAASLLLQKNVSRDIEEEHDFLKLSWSSFSSSSKDFFNNFFSSNLKRAEMMLNIVEGFEKSKGWVTKYEDNASQVFDSNLERNTPFEVLCHGDCFITNFLFRYGDSGVPVEVMLLDLQHCRVASPATDLTYLLFTSMHATFRKPKTKAFLQTYYSTFTSVLQSSKMAPPFTLEELYQEYKNKQEFGLLIANNLFSVTMTNSSDLPDYNTLDAKGITKAQEMDKKNCLEKMKNNPEYQSRFLGLFDFLED